MSLPRIVLIASLVATSMSLVASPSMAATPDVGYRIASVNAAPGRAEVEVSPWVWEPQSSDSLRIAVGSRTRRIVVRVWGLAGHRRGRLIEQVRSQVGTPWTTVARSRLTAADLAGGSTDPDRTRYQRAGFLAFDAATLAVEDNGGLAYSVVAPRDRRLILRFGARDEHDGSWTTVTRIVSN
jgi:hypothetical protein